MSDTFESPTTIDLTVGRWWETIDQELRESWQSRIDQPVEAKYILRNARRLYRQWRHAECRSVNEGLGRDELQDALAATIGGRAPGGDPR